MDQAKPCEQLSHRQRAATPVPFALYLLAGVRSRHYSDRVAVLWVQKRSNYNKLWPWVQLWTAGMDANTYDGPWPVIAHPPCGPWGNFKGMCFKQSKHHGIMAMKLVHRYGGVVEQPLGSSLFREHGDGRDLQVVDQGDYGHVARKRTLLYWV